jgi:Spy/CpxP family protein refolding chaperone
MRVNRVLGLTAALTLAVAVGAAAVVWAQVPRTWSGKGRGFGLRPLMALSYVGRQLNLTDQQKQQIKDIVRSHKDDIKALVDQGFATRKALREAVAGGNSDAVAAAAQQVSAVQLKGAQLRAQLRAKVFGDVLTADQRSKAGDLLARFEQKADQRRQRIDQFIDSF